MDFVPEIRQGNYGVRKIFRHVGTEHNMDRVNGQPVKGKPRKEEAKTTDKSADAITRLTAQQED